MQTNFLDGCEFLVIKYTQASPIILFCRIFITTLTSDSEGKIIHSQTFSLSVGELCNSFGEQTFQITKDHNAKFFFLSCYAAFEEEWPFYLVP